MLLGALIIACGTAAQSPPKLAPLAYKPLRLGTFSVSGWLLKQLETQAATLSGHLDLFCAACDQTRELIAVSPCPLACCGRRSNSEALAVSM